MQCFSRSLDPLLNIFQFTINGYPERLKYFSCRMYLSPSARDRKNYIYQISCSFYRSAFSCFDNRIGNLVRAFFFSIICKYTRQVFLGSFIYNFGGSGGRFVIWIKPHVQWFIFLKSESPPASFQLP